MSQVKSPLLILTLCYVAFIALGMPDAVLSVAWPSISDEFRRPLDQLGLIALSGVAGYMVTSYFSGSLTHTLKLGGLLILSCLLTITALTGITLMSQFEWMFVFVFIGGMGGGGIDSSLNAYVERHYSERVMQWLHASFGIGVTLGPLIMTYALTTVYGWRVGYWTVLLFILLMTMAFILFRSKWDNSSLANQDVEPGTGPLSQRATFAYTGTKLGMAAFFLYTGTEVGVGVWAYTILTEQRLVSPEIAGFWVSFYWGSFTIGRLIAGLIGHKLSAMKMTQIGAYGSVIGLLLFSYDQLQLISALALGIVGLCFAPIFPALISTTSKLVPKHHVGNAVGMQISAAGLGSASIPAIAGWIVKHYGLAQVAYLFLILSILFSLVIWRIKVHSNQPIS